MFQRFKDLQFFESRSKTDSCGGELMMLQIREGEGEGENEGVYRTYLL